MVFESPILVVTPFPGFRFSRKTVAAQSVCILESQTFKEALQRRRVPKDKGPFFLSRVTPLNV